METQKNHKNTSLASRLLSSKKYCASPVYFFNTVGNPEAEDNLYSTEDNVLLTCDLIVLKTKLTLYKEYQQQLENGYELVSEMEHSVFEFEDKLCAIEFSEYSQELQPLKDFVKAAIEHGADNKVVSSKHFPLIKQIVECQTTSKFYNKYYQSLYKDGKSGKQLLLEADIALNEVCRGIVPRRLRFQTRSISNNANLSADSSAISTE